ncbi:MAG: cob(I)yrinic acid a,c-diamide adenosyltransferase, partial [Acidimicrobiia bacterium]
MPRAPSLVLVNTGHGKGKSSAAFGVMGRGWARGWRVGVVAAAKEPRRSPRGPLKVTRLPPAAAV